MSLYFSIIVPVYNRPGELRELLQSLQHQEYHEPFEIVIVEDGSTTRAESIVKAFQPQLHIAYYYKNNSGPGDSRNYGMQRAKGNYFIFLDSDCILPPQYLTEVHRELQTKFVPCFGAPDTADSSFTNIQKAINHVMTSLLTTGGIRGSRKAIGRFQPRSFNMGIAKEVFENIGGFGRIHPGEDPDLTFRIWKAGYASRLFPKAFVYHKRRVDWDAFYTQMNKFGQVRPILNQRYPDTARLTYWFPSLFIIGLILSLLLALSGIVIPLGCYAAYFLLIYLEAGLRYKSFKVGFLAVIAALIQFSGYGTGFFTATLLLAFSKAAPEQLFPHLFFSSKCTQQKPKNRFNRRKAKVFSLFLISAFLAWLLSNLSESYEARTSFNIVYKNIPDTLSLGKNAARTLEVKLRTNGFQFLQYQLLHKKITLNASRVIYKDGNYYLPEDALQKQIEQQLSQNTSLLDLYQKQLAVDLYQVDSRTVPIQADLQLSFRQNHILKDTLKITPTHITIKGPKREVDCITSISTTPLALEELASDFSKEVALVVPEILENSTLPLHSVKIAGQVVKFSEKIYHIPLRVINAPENYHVKTFPNTVAVLCKAPLKQLKRIAPKDFEVIADYRQVESTTTNTLQLVLHRQPSNVYDVRLQEHHATFILEQL